jgi:ABC-type phosphate transport system auxiliary subunit
MLQKAVDEKLALRRESDRIEAKKVSAREQALNKLTLEERKLLGLN